MDKLLEENDLNPKRITSLIPTYNAAWSVK